MAGANCQRKFSWSVYKKTERSRTGILCPLQYIHYRSRGWKSLEPHLKMKLHTEKIKPSVRISVLHVAITSWSLKGKRLSLRRKRNDCTLNPAKPLVAKCKTKEIFLKAGKKSSTGILTCCVQRTKWQVNIWDYLYLGVFFNVFFYM